jgi:Putative zinc-finger
MSCNVDDLEALVAGELAPERASSVMAHAAGCEACGDELRWLRQERELMRRRVAKEALRPSELDQLWSGVEARIEEKSVWRRRLRTWQRPGSMAMAVAAAAALAFLGGRRAAERAAHTHTTIAMTQPAARVVGVSARAGTQRDPKLVLDEAEAQWRAAADELQQRYLGYRAQLSPREAQRLDQSLERTRRQIGEARALAGNDVQARVAVLDGYSDYVLSLHRLVSDLEESR